MNWSQERYINALYVAAKAHKNQKMPGSDIPYLVHINLVCMEVIAALQMETEKDGNLAMECAILHDTIEDTEVTWHELVSTFGKETADGVLALTKDEELSRPEQMKESLRRIRENPKEIWMVKMGDRISNLLKPPAYWNSEKIIQYREEAILIYETLKKGSPFLAGRLQGKIEQYQQYIKQEQG
ncbi:MAG: bifunctional (p)ppGpp synthetase/guanosine-3',5'-bis(diphosphate) 3'-pyrophosphohydrolase [bacterium]|nr:bifunctional (p)ppGpp synthetase/guanosine-3',5'-bis(diphosphate) 3'-pyrophosphohydrolase [bacterium]